MSTNSLQPNNVAFEQPRSLVQVAENQKRWQWVNNESFYQMLPAPYLSFYQNWVKLCLQWYDGYVPWVHGGSNGLLSTNIGTIIVDRASDSVFGGNIMFANAGKPTEKILGKDGKPIGKALNFISNVWTKETKFKEKIKRAIKDAFAGGFSLMKLNLHEGELWVDSLRADRFFISKTGKGKIRKCISMLSFYDDMTSDNKQGKKYCLVEERRFEKLGMFGDEIPVVEYKMYDSSAPIQYFSVAHDSYVRWEQLPKSVREAFKSEYSFRLNCPQAMNGFKGSLGVYLLKGSDDVSNVPQIGLAQSLLSNVLNYLFEFDYWNTCFNTEMYLSRGRVLVPKAMKSPQSKHAVGNQNTGLDDFLYVKVESTNPDAQKPEPIQFALRSTEWKEARNILLENIATNIGLSASTLASYLQDGAMKTAREVSAEESATTLFVETNRRRFEEPLNELLIDVLRYYGYVDSVEVRWSRAGMTNQTVLVDTLARAKENGLISPKKAHDSFNYDDDEEQNAEDFKMVEEAEKNKQYGNSLFDDKNYFG